LFDRPEGGERAVLVHLILRDKSTSADFQEFKELALSAGAIVVGSLSSSRQIPDSQYFIGSGKVEEIRALVLSERVEIVLFDHSLSPAQERNLEKALQCRVIDRTGLILDIFAKRARSYEGKLQVEMAQLQYLSTRLVRGWTHLERQKGGIGLRGPGEKQLEVDRRLIRERIKYIKLRLEKVRSQREQGRRSRQRASLPTVSLVGYTNAGKSTLFNALTGANSWVANQLFATLDPTMRALELPQIGKVIFADTVGFVSKLPHDLVEAFQATLEEVKDSDLLIHVVDSHDSDPDQRIKQVEEVLAEIEALALPRIEVYNKIDLLPECQPHVEGNRHTLVRKLFVSAQQGLGLSLIIDAVVELLSKDMMRGVLKLGVTQARIRALLYEAGAVLEETQDETEGFMILHFALPNYRWRKLCQEDPTLEQCLINE
jgi:GTP-binding protein HflX